MQTAECRERTGAVKTVSPYPLSVTGVKSSTRCAEMTTQAPRKTGAPIRLQISDLKLEFPAGTDPDILIRICRELMRI